MTYYIYPLRFLTNTHFGSSKPGYGLESVEDSISSTTLTSAICTELSDEPDQVKAFIEKIKNERIKLSGLFPFYSDADDPDGWHFYLPRLLQRHEVIPADCSYREIIRLARETKTQKKLKYIRAAALLSDELLFHSAYPNSSMKGLTAKVATRDEEPRPYYVGYYGYSEQAGLYFILAVENDDDRIFMEDILQCLGYTGIGGKRSSGYGKFELADDPIELSSEGFYKDTKAIWEMLSCNNAERVQYRTFFVNTHF